MYPLSANPESVSLNIYEHNRSQSATNSDFRFGEGKHEGLERQNIVVRLQIFLDLLK